MQMFYFGRDTGQRRKTGREGTNWCASSSPGTLQPRLAWLADVSSCANLASKSYWTSLALKKTQNVIWG